MADNNLDLDQYQIIGEPKGGGAYKKDPPAVSGIDTTGHVVGAKQDYLGQDIATIAKKGGEALYNTFPPVKAIVDRRDAYFDKERSALKPVGASPVSGLPAAGGVPGSNIPYLDEKSILTQSATRAGTDARPIDVPAKVASAASSNLPAVRTGDNVPVGYSGVRPLLTPQDAERKMRSGKSLTNADLSSIYGGGGAPLSEAGVPVISPIGATPGAGGSTDITALLKE